MALSAGVGAGSSIFSSILGGSAAKKQAEAIHYAADQAKATALELNNRSRKDLQPFRDLGVQSGGMLSDLFSGKTNIDDLFKGSSLYQFESKMGTRALDRQLSSRGAYNSGAGLESLALFDKSLVAEEGNRYFEKLFNTTQLGSNAAAQQASNTTQTGNNIAGIQADAGARIGQAYANQGAAYGAGAIGVSNAIQSGVTNWTNYSLYNPILQKLAASVPSGNGGGDFGFGANQFTPPQQRESLATYLGRK